MNTQYNQVHVNMNAMYAKREARNTFHQFNNNNK